MGIGVTLEGMAEIRFVFTIASDRLAHGVYVWAEDQVARCIEIGVNYLDKVLNG